jgi:4-nitrophenyl phosphatase
MPSAGQVAGQDERMGWVLDLDGVVWLGDEPIPGAADAVRRLQRAGETVRFVTNNSFGRRADVVDKLRRHGIDADGDRDVLTSAVAAATLIEPGERVLVCGGPGAVEEVERAGAVVVEGSRVDVVVVGYDPGFDYERMAGAATAVRHGARLIATNDDATYPTASGPVPGAGSILASIVTASGAKPTIAGKPHQPMVAVARDQVGREGIVVGDRPSTDGLFARNLGVRFGLVLTGVTSADDLPVEPSPDTIGDDLGALVERELTSPP